jgi:asparagine synthase (glutamine-hydrolysing)
MLPDGAVVIGHLFHSDGSPAGSQSFSSSPSHGSLGQHLLENSWGEYLLIEPAADHHGAEFLRDPSGGLPCVYSLHEGSGFVTSDISLATSLGLHHRQIDWDFVTQILLGPHIKTQRTGLVGIRELLPGFSLVLRGASTVARQDWSPWRFVATEQRHTDRHEAASQVRKTVEVAVKAWAGIDRTILLGACRT